MPAMLPLVAMAFQPKTEAAPHIDYGKKEHTGADSSLLQQT